MKPHWLANEERSQEWAYETLRGILIPVIRRLVCSVTCEGADGLPPTGPAILVANHRSTLDPLVIGGGLDRHVHFVAEGWLGTLGLGAMLERAGTILLPRHAHRYEAFRQAAGHALEAGEWVGIFPEGLDGFAQPSDRTRVGPFHGSFVRLWQEHATVPLVPVGIVSLGEEVHMRLPGWIFATLAPWDGRFRHRDLWAVFYREVRVRFGTPYWPDPTGPGEDPIEAIGQEARARVLALITQALGVSAR